MKILVVQSRPYQTFAGGDGSYIHAMIKHLSDTGCAVVGLTSGSTKGRPRAFVKLAYPLPESASWHFRSTFRLGRRYLAIGPQLVRDAVTFLRDRWRVNKVQPFAMPPDAGEQSWIARMLDREQPDLVILTFEAVGAVDIVKSRGTSLLALVGFLPIRSYALSDSSADRVSEQGVAREFVDAIHRADRAAFNSRDDCNFARETLDIERPIFVGMGFARQESHTLGQQSIVLFVGNKTEPNQEAVAWFLGRIWPAVRARAPTARFRIVGRVAQYFESDSSAGIECVGPVPALDKEYCNARLVVAPLMRGSAGVKTKVAEAISFGCPLVATSLGVDGGDVDQMDQAAFIADDPDTFAEKVIVMLLDDALWRQKQQGTSTVFQKLYSREAAYGELDEFIAELRPARRAGER